jgi:hypothetical protein
MTTVLSRIARRWQFSLADRRRVKPFATITLAPATPGPDDPHAADRGSMRRRRAIPLEDRARAMMAVLTTAGGHAGLYAPG